MQTTIKLGTIVIGSGLAGFNAADSLYNLGYKDLAILTEDINQGTSRNTGSDKQTYYKQAICSNQADSVYDLAKTLYDGGGMQGDIALVEAAYSMRSFMKLVELGVDFPRNRYGEYVGYKTDHDPRQRATSCGPFTSKIMVQALEKAVRAKNIKVYDRMQVVRLLTYDGRVRGLLALDLASLEGGSVEWLVFQADNIIMATGGPAGIYYYSAYPPGHTGMSGIALGVGAQAANLQDWQYGLASIQHRWNLSGTYQQVLPRYLSKDQQGKFQEFLPQYFGDVSQALSKVFLKGYQWPFDQQKIPGSSEIDWLVYKKIFHEKERIYLDFQVDPQGIDQDFSNLDFTTRQYLEKSDALLPIPFQRLKRMNPEAVNLYKRNGIDLATELLEIAVCAQHNNGGIAVNDHWESTIAGLYVAGEAAGTFGIYRPGGTALSSTQTGALRAAESIASSSQPTIMPDALFATLAEKEIQSLNESIAQMMSTGKPSNVVENRLRLQRQMSCSAAQIRDLKAIQMFQKQLILELEGFTEKTSIKSAYEIAHAFKTQDIMITQQATLSAMEECGQKLGSRGSALVMADSSSPESVQIDGYYFAKNNPLGQDKQVLTQWSDHAFVSRIETVAPLPLTQDWFETVWRESNSFRK